MKLPWMRVYYHDNDFTWAMKDALQTLWSIFRYGETSTATPGGYATMGAGEGQDPFRTAQELQWLRPCLDACIDAAYMVTQVESYTRGLRSRGDVTYDRLAQITERNRERWMSEYLNCDITFHEELGDEGEEGGQNSEVIWLNTTTGQQVLR